MHYISFFVFVNALYVISINILWPCFESDSTLFFTVWDSGSAKLFAAPGAQALATISADHAFTLGVKDTKEISRSQSLEHARELAGATHLPLSADLENG